MPRKRKNKRYFTKITEIAINAYNSIDDYRLKNKIYNRFIHYPFDKLSENVIHTYKTYYFDVPYDDVKANVVAFLNQKFINLMEQMVSILILYSSSKKLFI